MDWQFRIDLLGLPPGAPKPPGAVFVIETPGGGGYGAL